MRFSTAAKFIGFMLLVLLVAPTIARADTFEGKVIIAAADKLTIVDKDGDNEEFIVTSDTKVTLDGKPSRLGLLTAGNRVRVTATVKGQTLLASHVEARTVE